MLGADSSRSSNWDDIISQAISYIRGSNVLEELIAAEAEFGQAPRIAKLFVCCPTCQPSNVEPTSELSQTADKCERHTTVIDQQPARLNSFELLIKRAFDIVFAGTALVALMPLLALVAIAIKLDSPGPVIFRQTRHGFNGKPFQILKFRTMTVLEDGDSIKQAVRSDKRVTGVGLWLRRTGIDALPN